MSLFQNPVGFEQALGKTGRKPGFSLKFKVAVPKAEVLEQPQLIKDIERCGYDGIGKPEPLRNNLAGYWSRRIDETNRLVYRILENNFIEISGLRTHYGEK